MIIEILQRPRNTWTKHDQQILENFFLNNIFFRKIYWHQQFQKIIQMTHYAKIPQNSILLLDNNKRPQAIILLSGSITIYAKKITYQTDKYHQVIKINQVYQNYGQLTQQNSIMQTYSPIKIKSSILSHIIFIPAELYNIYHRQRQKHRIEQIFLALIKVYPDISQIDLKALSACGLYYQQYPLNHFIYRVCDTPQFVYVLVEGEVRIDYNRINFNSLEPNAILLHKPYTMFGNNDINLNQRITSAQAKSAYTRVLIIPKLCFIKLQTINKPSFKNKSLSKRKNIEKQFKLPQLNLSYERNIKQQQMNKFFQKAHNYIDFTNITRSRSKSPTKSPKSLRYSFQQKNNSKNLY